MIYKIFCKCGWGCFAGKTFKKGKLDKTDKIDKRGKFTRTKRQSFSQGIVSVTLIKNYYIIGHFINSDLSVLTDFDTVKNDLVNNHLITLKKPMLVDGINVYVRDSILLPPCNKSLAAIVSFMVMILGKL